MMTLQIWQFVLILLMVVLATVVASFFVIRKLFKKQLEKNPPVNEQMIRAMFQQMGRTASEKQIRAVMNSMKQHQTK